MGKKVNLADKQAAFDLLKQLYGKETGQNSTIEEKTIETIGQTRSCVKTKPWSFKDEGQKDRFESKGNR